MTNRTKPKSFEEFIENLKKYNYPPVGSIHYSIPHDPTVRSCGTYINVIKSTDDECIYNINDTSSPFYKFQYICQRGKPCQINKILY